MKNFRPILLLYLCAWPLLLVAQETAEDFYNTAVIREIRLEFEAENWQESLDSLRLQGNGMTIGMVRIDGQEYPNAGVRFKDSRSFAIGSPRNAFVIRLDYADKSQNHLGIKRMELSNALRDPSMVREVLGYEIARKYMPAPEANYARLFVNDEFYGLMVNIEAVDDRFLKKHYGDSKGTFVKCTPPAPKDAPAGCKTNTYASLEYDDGGLQCYKHNYLLKSSGGWDDLVKLTQLLSEKSDKLDEWLHVDRTLWMLAFNNVVVNLSSYTGRYSQNYYLYRDPAGRFNPILWDLNLAFGSYKNTGEGSDLDLKGLQNMDPLLQADNDNKPLIQALLSDPLYKKIYLDHIRTLNEQIFENNYYEKRAEELQTLIAGAFYNDPNKYYTSEEFNSSLTTTIGDRSKIPGIVELMSKRSRFLKKHSEISILPPEISQVEVQNREKYAATRVTSFKISAKVEKFPSKVYLYYRYQPDQEYQKVMMMDDGSSNDMKSGDDIFGVEIQPDGKNESIEFFILAENAKAANFFPVNYVYKPQKVSLSELN